MKLLSKSLIIGVSLAAMVACSSNKEAATKVHEGHEAAGHVEKDLQEKTSSLQVLPKFLANQREEIRMIYQIAAANADLLQWMPCYCGCGESVGHQSNKNCFIKEVNKDGSVVWDDHGTRCGVCLNIALESAKLKKDGLADKDIRAYIDGKYKSGFAKPTSTPMPL
ncbi:MULTISPECIES: PCYCGC domain-containing protein [Paenibacillus]|uniref:PCYCGC domain-containing protein n=1 Tax=Paenibacillus radicis (ex Xue et al. 2023) TaxID=2972489 RepID=A0ABT1YBD4_9BACL|nr:PCYCGC domain-containing protein [Paenibacillus radicis (ex Xue et al. 2023)]MCR8630502.1 PCYCGC domain-containing protein [Paenibacillus radicis (ex Xue et al. 2023)]